MLIIDNLIEEFHCKYEEMDEEFKKALYIILFICMIDELGY